MNRVDRKKYESIVSNFHPFLFLGQPRLPLQRRTKEEAIKFFGEKNIDYSKTVLPSKKREYTRNTFLLFSILDGRIEGQEINGRNMHKIFQLIPDTNHKQAWLQLALQKRIVPPSKLSRLIIYADVSNLKKEKEALELLL